MIEIITLFLGLYHGMQTVELDVAERAPVAEVELLLDGETVATLARPPWRLRVDLGPVLAPHDLVAVARDARGVDLGRARRWINREFEQPSGAEDSTAVVVGLDPGVRLPPATAMGGWFSTRGEPLEVLRVERGAAEVVIVRDPAVQPFLERTARFFFQLRLEGLPWHTLDLADKRTFVEAAREALARRGDSAAVGRAAIVWEQWNNAFSFGDDAGVRFISPRAAPASRIAQPTGIFSLTLGRPSNEHGLLWHNAVVRPLQFRVRVADAVAMAGLESHAGRGRRAVVLMMAGEAMGPSRYPPAAVRDYLEDLQVPLFVWHFGLTGPDRPATSDGTPGSEAWGEVHDLTHDRELPTRAVTDWLARVHEAVGEVRKDLRRQRVVWLNGAHLPDEIELSEQAAGIRFAGTTPPTAAEGAD